MQPGHGIDAQLAIVAVASGQLALAVAPHVRRVVAGISRVVERQTGFKYHPSTVLNAQMSLRYNVAIALVDIAGLSTAEAAVAMGIPRGTVLSRLHRGRRSLALLLEDQVKDRER